MYYIYLPYALILGCLMFYECHKRAHPKWWALLVLAAPVTTPYFIFKSRKRSGVILFMIFMTTFSVMAASEVYLYLQMKEKFKYAHLPPLTRQVVRFSETLSNTTQRLDKALVTLEMMSKVESRVIELKRTIEFIAELRVLISQNQAAINRMVKFTSDYKSYFVKKDLNWVYHIQLFYTNRNVVQHYNSLETYLNNFEALLKYTYENFDKITKLKDKEALKNYDEYYLRYRRAVDSHNRLNVQRIEFQNDFLLKYPDIKPYLPGKRQTETFLLWGE
ncbi:MAG: hypothetical protein MI863_24305 [Desulfobacterales bacterium]|nr:hypothetical protein [Desulfobacterales bacterium]